jgi:peptidoglycan/xylan/chitin deacetylase (PgdA/CDA1 family)
MKYERIKAIGQALRGLQTHRLNAAFSARNYVRVTYTHQVLPEYETNFESLVAYLAKTYQPITPGEFFKFIKDEEPLYGRHVLLTFDDGLMSSYRAIKTTLAKFGIKAIVFIPTQILELKTREDMKRFAWQQLAFNTGDAPASLREEEYVTMGAREMQDLVRDGHSIYPHTHSHKRLSQVRDEVTAMEELVKPKTILGNIVQRPMDAFAFPVGTERVVSSFCFPYIKREYQFCFSALAGKNTIFTDPYLLRRDCMNANYDLAHVRNMEEGVFDIYYGYKMDRLKKAFHAY